LVPGYRFVCPWDRFVLKETSERMQYHMAIVKSLVSAG